MSKYTLMDNLLDKLKIEQFTIVKRHSLFKLNKINSKKAVDEA